MEDTLIVDLYLARKEEAIAQTTEKYGTRLRTISLGIVRDPETAEECENDTYLQAWNRIPPTKPYEYLFAFLARIIRNISIDVCRSRNRLKRYATLVELRTERTQCIPASDDPAAEVDKLLLGQLISRYLFGLSPEKRVIFLRRYWYMDSIKAISEYSGFTQSKITSMLQRTRDKLRKRLIEEGYL